MSTRRDRMYARIEEHGRQLLVLFPDAIERDPVKLCKRLRRIERDGNYHALQLCNDADYCNQGEDINEAIGQRILKRANTLLGTDRVWLNLDPRGPALKVNLSDGERLYQDWGSNGIIAPDLS